MPQPNAKICPRCQKVVPVQYGVCDHCARLFRTEIGGQYAQNQTILFDHLAFPPAPAPVPRLTRGQRLRQRYLSLFQDAWQRLRALLTPPQAAPSVLSLWQDGGPAPAQGTDSQEKAA